MYNSALASHSKYWVLINTQFSFGILVGEGVISLQGSTMERVKLYIKQGGRREMNELPWWWGQGLVV